MQTTQRKRDIAVAQAIATFTKYGWNILLPLTESAAYDVAVDTGSTIARVQVRFTSSREVDLRRVHSNARGYVIKKAKADAYDWLYVYTADESEFLVPKCLTGRRSITFHDDTYNADVQRATI